MPDKSEPVGRTQRQVCKVGDLYMEKAMPFVHDSGSKRKSGKARNRYAISRLKLDDGMVTLNFEH